MVAMISPRDIVHLPLDELCSWASDRRREYFGNRVSFCAIVNIRSGDCGMDCRFCAQSRHNTANVQHFQLLPGEVLESGIRKVAAWRVSNVGLGASGGVLHGREFARLVEFLAGLEDGLRDRICLSVGRLDKEQILVLKGIGIRHLHHNLETSESYYPHICTTQSWRARRKTVENALDAGLEVCSGGLFGIGESWQDRIDLAMELYSMGVRNIPLNFLNPQPGTPMGGMSPLPPDESLRVVALFRLLAPGATLRIAGGRLQAFGGSRKDIFSAGANALMTGNYLTTAGAMYDTDLAMVEELGLELTTD